MAEPLTVEQFREALETQLQAYAAGVVWIAKAHQKQEIIDWFIARYAEAFPHAEAPPTPGLTRYTIVDFGDWIELLPADWKSTPARAGESLTEGDVYLAAAVDADRAETFRKGWQAGHVALGQEQTLRIEELEQAIRVLAAELREIGRMGYQARVNEEYICEIADQLDTLAERPS